MAKEKCLLAASWVTVSLKPKAALLVNPAMEISLLPCIACSDTKTARFDASFKSSFFIIHGAGCFAIIGLKSQKN